MRSTRPTVGRGRPTALRVDQSPLSFLLSDAAKRGAGAQHHVIAKERCYNVILKPAKLQRREALPQRSAAKELKSVDRRLSLVRFARK